MGPAALGSSGLPDGEGLKRDRGCIEQRDDREGLDLRKTLWMAEWRDRGSAELAREREEMAAGSARENAQGRAGRLGAAGLGRGPRLGFLGVFPISPVPLFLRVVKEEISDDNAKLPCFNGRVVSWLVLAENSHSDAGSQCTESLTDLPPPIERTGGIGDSRPPSFQVLVYAALCWPGPELHERPLYWPWGPGSQIFVYAALCWPGSELHERPWGPGSQIFVSCPLAGPLHEGLTGRGLDPDIWPLSLRPQRSMRGLGVDPRFYTPLWRAQSSMRGLGESNPGPTLLGRAQTSMRGPWGPGSQALVYATLCWPAQSSMRGLCTGLGGLDLRSLSMPPSAGRSSMRVSVWPWGARIWAGLTVLCGGPEIYGGLGAQISDCLLPLLAGPKPHGGLGAWISGPGLCHPLLAGPELHERYWPTLPSAGRAQRSMRGLGGPDLRYWPTPPSAGRAQTSMRGLGGLDPRSWSTLPCASQAYSSIKGLGGLDLRSWSPPRRAQAHEGSVLALGARISDTGPCPPGPGPGLRTLGGLDLRPWSMPPSPGRAPGASFPVSWALGALRGHPVHFTVEGPEGPKSNPSPCGIWAASPMVTRAPLPPRTSPRRFPPSALRLQGTACGHPAVCGTGGTHEDAPRINGHPKLERRREPGTYDSASTVLSSELESSSFIDSEDEDTSRLSSSTEQSTSSRLIRKHKRRRRKQRMRQIDRSSSFSSITDSTMSLNIITVTLNMEKYNFLGISIDRGGNSRPRRLLLRSGLGQGPSPDNPRRARKWEERLGPHPLGALPTPSMAPLPSQVNDVNFENMSNDDAVRVLREIVSKPGPISLTVAKCWDPTPRSYFTIPRGKCCLLGLISSSSVGQEEWAPPSRPIQAEGRRGCVSLSELEESPLTVKSDMGAIVKVMQLPDSGLEIRDRMWLKITISNAVIGADVVDWLYTHVEGFKDRREARKYASSMLKHGYLRHTVNKITFSEQCYYVFGDLCSNLAALNLNNGSGGASDQDTLAPLPHPAAPWPVGQGYSYPYPVPPPGFPPAYQDPGFSYGSGSAGSQQSEGSRSSGSNRSASESSRRALGREKERRTGAGGSGGSSESEHTVRSAAGSGGRRERPPSQLSRGSSPRSQLSTGAPGLPPLHPLPKAGTRALTTLSGPPGGPPVRELAAVPPELTGSRQSFQKAMGNPCEFFVDIM
ncbi:segment polarity protein dishevelled homolog DVL-1 [Sarcophilus harrisii]|uniref:segment polarity protein dishevelled homolog DVL-1 n=1 Tax=Sarcophilus harrisii TaxID=9305 RepID=UPI001301D410|nr:segment polarity protein dishevelled homolog DVL-1 [Sarcophilus harrisii]